MRDVPLLELGLIVGNVDVEPAVGHQPAFVERVLVPVPQGDELVVLLVVWKGKPRDPARQIDRDVAGALQFLGQRHEFGAGRHAVEAAGLDADRVDFAPTEHPQDLVARLLEREAPAHRVPVCLGHANAVWVAEEIRRVQHHHVQAVALDPFAAIDQPPQGPELPLDLNAEGAFDRVHGAHLVGDRADAADAGNDVRYLLMTAPPQQRLEEARWLEDPEPGRGHPAVGDLEVERSLALDPGEILDIDRPSRHGPCSRSGRVRQRH